jgi:hypothetical protein
MMNDRFVYQKFRKPKGGEQLSSFFYEFYQHLEAEFERLTGYEPTMTDKNFEINTRFKYGAYLTPNSNENDINVVYKQLIEKLGAKNQIIVAIEELSELQKELCKYLRDKTNIRNISEEMADVEIMLEQLKLIFENEKPVNLEKKYKLERTYNRYLKVDLGFWDKDGKYIEDMQEIELSKE